MQADKDFRQLVYTNRNHSIFGGNTRNHLFRQCVNFFNEKLASRQDTNFPFITIYKLLKNWILRFFWFILSLLNLLVIFDNLAFFA